MLTLLQLQSIIMIRDRIEGSDQGFCHRTIGIFEKCVTEQILINSLYREKLENKSIFVYEEAEILWKIRMFSWSHVLYFQNCTFVQLFRQHCLLLHQNFVIIVRSANFCNRQKSKDFWIFGFFWIEQKPITQKLLWKV